MPAARISVVIPSVVALSAVACASLELAAPESEPSRAAAGEDEEAVAVTESRGAATPRRSPMDEAPVREVASAEPRADRDRPIELRSGGRGGGSSAEGRDDLAAVPPEPSLGGAPARRTRGARSGGSASPAPSPRTPSPRPRPSGPPSSPGVKAGAADDNLAFNAYLDFLAANRGLGLSHVVRDRVVLEVRDANGRPVAGARVRVDGVERRTTYADGRALLHPERWAVSANAMVEVRAPGGERVEVPMAAVRSRRLAVATGTRRREHARVPLDIAFIIDTTGSMGDEIQKLKQTLDVIVFQIRNARPSPDLRLGMVLFRDRGDTYVTQVVPFTSNIADFERQLAQVRAAGGGDGPEDVQSALRAAVRELGWRSEGLRLGFLIGDAPPHLDYGQGFTYLDAAEAAARRGIKLATIGASGLDRRGELVWRQIAQATLSPFVFLTYGEQGDSEGSPSTVSHHVGSNWVAQDLDAIVVRMVKSELAHLAPRTREPRKDWFSAAPSPDRPANAVLEELFTRSAKQLVDYAVEPLGRATPIVVLPIDGAPVRLTEALKRRVELGLSRRPEFRLIAAEARAELMKTLADQLRLSVDEARAPEVGRMVPAELAVLGRLGSGEGGGHEVLLELVRIETGEVLSLSLMEIDRRLL